MTEKEIETLLKESYDLHVHVGPDLLPRKYTVRNLYESEKGKLKGIAVKNHTFPTTAWIKELNGEIKDTELELIGSITLNYFSGGFNPSAIYACSALAELPVVIWFPTIHALNHLLRNHSEYEIPPDWVGDPNFLSRKKNELKAIRVTEWTEDKLIRKANYVLDDAEKYDCIIATGHISWKEAKLLSEIALSRKLKVIVTHPMQKDINMPEEYQMELALKGAYIEFCYVMWLNRDNPEDYKPSKMAELIRDLGAAHCLLTSDTGQVNNPSPSECLKDFMRLLEKEGIKKSEFEQMLIENPRKILT